MTYTLVSRHPRSENNAKGLTTLNIIIILGFIVLLATFLIENESLVGKSYQLRNYENQLKEHQELIGKLQIKQTEQSSLPVLEGVARDLQLVAVDKVKYLREIQSSVAMSGNLLLQGSQ